MIWLYDGSWKGLLCAFDEATAAVAEPRRPGAFPAPGHDPAASPCSAGDSDAPRFWNRREARQAAAEASLFSGEEAAPPPPGPWVAADRNRAARVEGAFLRRAGAEALEVLRDAFGHREPGKEAALWGFWHLARARGASVLDHLAEPAVADTRAWARAVQREVHRWLGLLRFQQLDDGSLFAPLESDHFVLRHVAEHFRERLGAAQVWMIHDRPRRIAVLHRAGRLRWAENLSQDRPLPLSADEARYQALWTRFHSDIANPQRLNPELQRNFVPKKVRGAVTEFQNSTSRR